MKIITLIIFSFITLNAQTRIIPFSSNPTPPSIVIAISTVYSVDIIDNFAAASTWTITGITVPSDATAAILLVPGGYMNTKVDKIDKSNFDGDTDDHFTYVASGGDDGSNRVSASVHYLKYGQTGFPTRGATNQTLSGSFSDEFNYGGAAMLFFLSNTVTDGTFLIGADSSTSADGADLWTSDDLGTVGANDMAFIMEINYQAAVNVSGDSQTILRTDDDGTVYWSVAYEFAEDVVTGTAATSGFEAEVAFAIKGVQ